MLCTCIRGEGVSVQVCLFAHLIPLLHNIGPLEPISSKYIIMKNMSYVPIHTF